MLYRHKEVLVFSVQLERRREMKKWAYRAYVVLPSLLLGVWLMVRLAPSGDVPTMRDVEDYSWRAALHLDPRDTDFAEQEGRVYDKALALETEADDAETQGLMAFLLGCVAFVASCFLLDAPWWYRERRREQHYLSWQQPCC